MEKAKIMEVSELAQLHKDWIVEAEAAIRAVDPSAPAVVDAVRAYAVLGKPGAISARLADGTEWLIDGEKVRRYTAEELADRAQMKAAWADS